MCKANSSRLRKDAVDFLISRLVSMKAKQKWLVLLLPLAIALGGCVGAQTYGTAARAGDTITVELGRQLNLARQNVTVTITDAAGAVTTYGPNDSHVRGIVDMYPDPVSRAVVGTMTNQDLGYNATTTGYLINSQVTNNDNDWFQTVMVLDLPTTMATGDATVSITDNGTGTAMSPSTVTVVPGAGSSNLFTVWLPWGSTLPLLSSSLYPNMLMSMERADRYTVNLTTTTVVPHSIQMTFAHTSGVGVPWVVNPRGDIKNVVWHDDGTTITVMVTPTQGTTLTRMRDFKFYIAGGVTGLTQTSLKAYDINGVAVSGVTATVN